MHSAGHARLCMACVQYSCIPGWYALLRDIHLDTLPVGQLGGSVWLTIPAGYGFTLWEARVECHCQGGRRTVSGWFPFCVTLPGWCALWGTFILTYSLLGFCGICFCWMCYSWLLFEPLYRLWVYCVGDSHHTSLVLVHE